MLKEEFQLTDEQINQFNLYRDLLLEWNEKFNLTAITEKDEIEEKHFIDSLLPTKFYSFKKGKLLDIGSGAGFPGIPLAIFLPDLNVTLLESNGKKVTFLNEVVNRLQLKNVKVINGRAEDLKLRSSFDYVTGRAVKSLNIFVELGLPFVKVHGVLLAYKGDHAEEEILEAKSALRKLNSAIVSKYSYSLPKSQDNRNLLVILKQKEVQKKYPRNYSEIIKNPL